MALNIRPAQSIAQQQAVNRRRNATNQRLCRALKRSNALPTVTCNNQQQQTLDHIVSENDETEDTDSANVTRRRVINLYRAIEGNTAIRPTVTVSYLGEMSVPCQDCEALHFRRESIGQSCCHHGKVALPLLAPYPAQLRQLLTSTSREARNFQENIRQYNSSMAFASMGANFAIPPGSGPYCFRIHGQIYHYSGALHPELGEASKFAQLYIIDPTAANNDRLAAPQNASCLATTMELLDSIIRRHNPFVAGYRHMVQVERDEQTLAATERREPRQITMYIRRDRSNDQRRYNVPLADEVAVVFVSTDGAVPTNRDFAVHPHGRGLQRISPLSANCDPMIYPLLFPSGEPGWCPGILHRDDRRTAVRQQVTCLQFYAYRLAIRPQFSQIHSAGKLTQQYIVDAYVRVESIRMQYLRDNQKQLRVELYQSLLDYVTAQAAARNQQLGTIHILPSSFSGSPRALQQNYQDAMAIVRKYGQPDLFITMTCNPKWREITDSLPAHQKASDRPDIVSRVFRLKLQELLDDVVRQKVFGTIVAHIHVIEFQKRGLPHAHMLFILADADKPRDAEKIDRFVCAEIPDVTTDPTMHDLVRRHMVHGPCGALKPASPCMQDGRCAKNFPKHYEPVTSNNVDGYPRYRRRESAAVATVGAHTVDNRWIVPYNSYLLYRFNAHINVEVCTSIKSVKYLFKYVYKGHDRADVHVHLEPTFNYDEISMFLDARYVSASEAAWRLFEFRMHGQSHTVVRLPIHLPNFQSVFFAQGHEREAVTYTEHRRTMLQAYYELNQRDANARELLYQDVPSYYVFRNSAWVPRQRRSAITIGRMCMVNPRDEQRYFLRLLLTHVRGALNDEHLRTVNGHICATHREAAREMSLLNDDTEWNRCLQEAATLQMPKQLRQLFVTLLLFAEVSDPLTLWQLYKHQMSEDFMRNGEAEPAAYERTIREIDVALNGYGMHCTTFGLPAPSVDVATQDMLTTNIDDDDQTQLNAQAQQTHYQRGQDLMEQMNPEQLASVESILAAVNGISEVDSKCFFLDGPGGTGKTFTYNTLYHLVCGQSGHVTAVASTGIAATLLPNGRTAHSYFKIPVPVLQDSSCRIAANSSTADEIRRTSLIIWDEASMAHVYALQAVDRLLRDVTGIKTPFGGKTIVLGGDFRQTLPVVRRATRGAMVAASCKGSALWSHFKTLRLVRNMRAGENEQAFASWLLALGEGRLPVDCMGQIDLPVECLCQSDLITAVFPQTILDSGNNNNNLSKSVILTSKNALSLTINEQVLQRLPGEAKSYLSSDSVDDASNNNNDISHQYPTEFLHSLTPTGMPPHQLNLKVGAVAILLRNIDVRQNLCNGSRLLIRSLLDHVIEAEVLLGANAGARILLPRISLTPSDTDLPFALRRKQFPLRLAFAMTINKSQGQTFDRVGLALIEPVFTHGQLYVAFSRVRSLASISVQLPVSLAGKTTNIVFNEVL